ncbi:MAG: hypothetical protein WD572_07935, partial [Gammaproteobacteria bacterium]
KRIFVPCLPCCYAAPLPGHILEIYGLTTFLRLRTENGFSSPAYLAATQPRYPAWLLKNGEFAVARAGKSRIKAICSARVKPQANLS